MTQSRTAALSGILVSKRGLASQLPEHPGLEEAQTVPFISQPPEEARNPQGLYYKALTLKVDRDRFMKLKSLGVRRDLRSQALMTEALDLLFAKHGL